MHECFAVCMSVHHGRAWCLWRSEEGCSSLKLELEVVLSHPVFSGNQIHVLHNGGPPLS